MNSTSNSQFRRTNDVVDRGRYRSSGGSVSLMTTRLTLSSRIWASHFGQSVPFQLSIVCDAVSVIRVDLQYGQRKLTCRSRSISRSREILSTTRCTWCLPNSWRKLRTGPILTNRPNCGKRQLFPRAQASRRLRPATGLEMQGAVGTGGGLVEPSELREDEALVDPCAAIRPVDLQRPLVGLQRLLVLPEARERVSLVVPRDLVVRMDLDGGVEASQCVDEAPHLRQRVALVHPRDLVARVDVQRHVDGPQRFLVPAEQDEGRALSVPGDLRPRDARSGRGDGAVVLLEGALVVPARHVALREDQFPSKDRRRMPPPDLRDRERRRPRDGRDDPDEPWDGPRGDRSGRRGEGQARQGDRACDREDDPPAADREAFGRPREREGRSDRKSDGDRRGPRVASEGGPAELKGDAREQRETVEQRHTADAIPEELQDEDRAHRKEDRPDAGRREGLPHDPGHREARGAREDDAARDFR